MTTTMQPLTLDQIANGYHPSISFVIEAYVTSLYYVWGDEQRQRLEPYVSRLFGTATGPKDEETRAWLVVDWLVRTHVPALLRATGLEDHARTLEGLARINDPASARAALPPLNEAHTAAYPDPTAGLWSDEARIAARIATLDAALISDWAAKTPSDAWRAACWMANKVARWTAAAGDDTRASVLALLDAMLEVSEPCGFKGIASTSLFS